MDIDAIVAPVRYQVAKAERSAAYERYNYAAVALELAQIKERFAELYSQYDPINAIKDMQMGERDKLCASAYYVIHGRLPVKAN